jgi:putative transposase
MLTEQQLVEQFDRLQIPDEGRKRIRHIRDNPPSATSSTSKKAGKTRYTSLKMPFVVEAAADSTEWAAMVHWDHDNETDEFYPQPEPLKITHKVGTSDATTTHLTRTDYLRVTKTAFIFTECKTEDELDKLAKSSPDRYQRQGDGTWRSPCTELAAAEFGCRFEIRSSRQNNWVLLENRELLKDYYIGTPGEVNQASRRVVAERMKSQGWISTFDLIHMDPAIPADDLYLQIIRGEVFFPLNDLRLSDQDRALVFRDEATYLAFSTFINLEKPVGDDEDFTVSLDADDIFTWDGETWKVVNPGEQKVAIQRISANEEESNLAELTPKQILALVKQQKITVSAIPRQRDSRSGEEILRRASPKDIREANLRYAVLFGRETTEPNPLSARCRRSRFYWQAQYKLGEVQYGNGFIGLLPKRSGNRKRKASEASLELAVDVIRADWETVRQKKRLTSWGRYSVLARSGGTLKDFEGKDLPVPVTSAGGLTPVSYVTYCKIIKSRSGYDQAKSRIGEKAAQPLEPEYLSLEQTTPKHGVRKWHIGHIDHTPLPLKFVHSKLGEIVKTIWLSLLIDAFTRKVVAWYLSFDEPSYRSCMMVIRDCVRRHNRVHQRIVCDQGPEFNSEYWEMLCGLLHISKKERRSGRPKEGTVVERVFKTTFEQFISHLMGATEIVERYFRAISPEVDPTRHAQWTMDRMDKGLDKYLTEVYHKNHQAGIGMSPDEADALSLRSHGLRLHRVISYNDAFIAQTCPAVHRGTAKITPQGIKCNYRWFNCAEFGLPGLMGTRVPGRYDPFNAGVAWAFLNGKWHMCASEHYAIFSTYSERAIKLATERLHLLDRRSGRAIFINAERLAQFLMTTEGEEATAVQTLHDEEAAMHRSRINGPTQTLPATERVPRSEASGSSTPTMKTSKLRMLEDL